MKIGLGTVQFGLDYGISNSLGRPPETEIRRIVALAGAHGIDTIDTAALYGESEAVLGRCVDAASGFRVVTKTPQFSGPAIDAEEVADSFQRSLDRLRVDRVYGLLVHRGADLLAPDGETLWRSLTRLRAAGRVERIGASSPTPEMVRTLAERYDLSLIQVPVNLLDQRMLADGQLAALHARGVEVHARSAFLQGLLLMDPEAPGPHFDSVRPKLRALAEWCRRRGRPPLASALDFVLSRPEIDRVICGVATTAQLAEILNCVDTVQPVERADAFAHDDPAILLPHLWPN